MHGPIGYGPGMYEILGVVGAIVGFLGTLILIAIVVAVLFFVIRFLIVGTKAAQLYIDRNKAAAPASPVVEPVETTAPITPAPETGVPASTGSTEVRKPRIPRTPPTAS